MHVWDGGIEVATLRVDGQVTVTGSGTIELGDGALVGLDSPSGWVLTSGAGHTIRGAGVVSAPLVNDGEVSADRSGVALRLTTSWKTNNGTFAARTGGRLKLEVVPTNYNGGNHRLTGGTWIAEDGVIEMPGCAVDSNAASLVLEGNGSAFDLDGAGNSALAGLVRNSAGGSLTIRNGRDLATASNFANTGLIEAEGMAFTCL
jgi:hypothetical protein